jgi:hypothetical protein
MPSTTIKNGYMGALSWRRTYQRHYTADHPLRPVQQLRQLGDVRRDPLRLRAIDLDQSPTDLSQLVFPRGAKSLVRSVRCLKCVR